MPRGTKAAPTKFDKERQRLDAKNLVVIGGYTLEDAARLVQISLSTIKNWSVKEAWFEQISRTQELANKQVGRPAKPKMDLAQKIVFDRSIFGKTTHRILAKGARKAAKAWMRQPEEVFIEHAGGFKATVEAAAKLHPESFGEEAGNRFAINLEINSIAHSPECRQLTPEEVREFGEG